MTASAVPSPLAPPTHDPACESHLVLRGPHGRQALWPEVAPVPEGWRTEFGPAPHAECVRRLEPGGAGEG